MFCRVRFYKNKEVKKAFRERNKHILKSWIRLDFKCGPNYTYTTSGYFPNISGRIISVECECGKVFHDEWKDSRN